jgi:hypothetical protein
MRETGYAGTGGKVKRKSLTVTEAARRLGVHRVHLSYVIHGHRRSKRLTRRYRELLRAQNKILL